MTEIVLASASPRRRELMEQAGLSFSVLPAVRDEVPGERSPEETVRFLSCQKAREVAERLQEGEREVLPESFRKSGGNLLVIGADTVVSLDKEILGKPRDRADAGRMLRMLSGRTHEVWTGVTVIGCPNVGETAGGDGTAEHLPDGWRTGPAGREITFAVCTGVDVASLSEEEIEAYLATGEADDKAGAYGIQGRFAIHVRGIRGDYNNVVGLPIAALYRILRESFLM
ncbi:MAG: Maf family protein [Lachnospiraceae bacterium]|nr:Maf family protein [Lachnospiraceae bacterium]